MAYVIRYGAKRKQHSRTIPRKFSVAAAAVILLLAMCLLCRDGAPLKILLPGDPQVTEMAMDALRADLKSGMPLGEALTVFGKEIVHGAELAE